MSRFENTPAELGEMEVKEAITRAIENSLLHSIVAYSYYALEASCNYLTLSNNDTFAVVCTLIEKVVTKYKKDAIVFDRKELATLIANELISCNYITQDTLEELGQKQLNEAY